MSQTVHIWIKGDTQGDIKGDSTVTSLGREDSIEAFDFEHMVKTQREASSGMASGERIHSPVTFTKRFDRSSPLLYAALCNNEPIEVTIRFYRPNPAGDGTTEQFYTIRLKKARISSIRSMSPNCLDDRTANQPPFENVSIVFGEITWSYSSGSANTEHQDSWSGNK